MLAAPPKVEEQRPQARLGYRPALDGVRALAVAVVFAYHAHLGWAKAGFIGVDVFFVLSGYLITALLLTERRREGSIDLLRFWRARARRLLPALLVVLAAVAVAVPILAAEQAHRLRADLLAALAYVSNWRLIFENRSYFQAAGRPPLLQHLWSLAVEEQFYLLWPPILWLAMRAKGTRRLVKPLLFAALASTILMVFLYRPFSDPSRVYYGTDTRAAALLIGAALAAATTRWQVVDRVPQLGRIAYEIAGIVCLAALAWTVSHVSEYDPDLYRGGFLVVALLAAGLVAACARPGRRGPLGTALGSRPMVWVGRRSYAIYLWFWPVLLLTRAHYDVPFGGLGLLALQIGITLTLAALSYRFVERPIRQGALGRLWDDLRHLRHSGRPVANQTAILGLALSTMLVCVGVGVAITHPEKTSPILAEAAGVNSALASTVGADPSLGTITSPSTTVAPGAASDPSTPDTSAPTTTVPAVPTIPITAIGDSVMLGAKAMLERQVNGITVDAATSRQVPAVVSTIQSYRESGQLQENVIIHTGNNAVMTTSQFEQVMEALKDVPHVVVVNIKVSRGYQDPNNSVLAGVTERYRNAVLVDWHAISSGSPDLFYDDGIHLNPQGQRLYVQSILSVF
ncbi:MAG: acyltransferase family protein [Acidimicrobiales bacterium]